VQKIISAVHIKDNTDNAKGASLDHSHCMEQGAYWSWCHHSLGEPTMQRKEGSFDPYAYDEQDENQGERCGVAGKKGG
jgi:hypothetical protein